MQPNASDDCLLSLLVSKFGRFPHLFLYFPETNRATLSVRNATLAQNVSCCNRLLTCCIDDDVTKDVNVTNNGFSRKIACAFGWSIVN